MFLVPRLPRSQYTKKHFTKIKVYLRKLSYFWQWFYGKEEGPGHHFILANSQYDAVCEPIRAWMALQFCLDVGSTEAEGHCNDQLTLISVFP